MSESNINDQPKARPVVACSELVSALREYRKRHKQWAWLRIYGDGSGTVQASVSRDTKDDKEFSSIDELMEILRS